MLNCCGLSVLDFFFSLSLYLWENTTVTVTMAVKCGSSHEACPLSMGQFRSHMAQPSLNYCKTTAQISSYCCYCQIGQFRSHMAQPSLNYCKTTAQISSYCCYCLISYGCYIHTCTYASARVRTRAHTHTHTHTHFLLLYWCCWFHFGCAVLGHKCKEFEVYMYFTYIYG